MSHDLKMPGDYEYQALHYGNPIQKQWNKNRLLLLKHLRFVTREDSVLDAGCGSGNVVIAFAKHSKKIQGWDINNNSIIFLNSLLKEKGIKNARAVKQNLLDINSSQKFSKVVLSEVIEHFAHENYTKMLKNLHSVMVPNGRIFITTPNDKSIWPILDISLNFIQKYIQRIPTFHDRHLGHFNKDILRKDVEKAGFRVIKSGTMNAFSPFLYFLPQKTRNKMSIWESEHITFGPLLFVVAEKK